jgi:hypothetical protein
MLFVVLMDSFGFIDFLLLDALVCEAGKTSGLVGG